MRDPGDGDDTTAAMRKLLKDLNLFDGPRIAQFVQLAAAVQLKRYEGGNSGNQQVTRSTAIVVLGELDKEIYVLLENAGLNWERFYEGLGIDVLPEPIDVSDVNLSDEFRRTIESFHERFPDIKTIGLEEIARAILSSVISATESGRVQDHLARSGADTKATRTALASLEDKLNPTAKAIVDWDAPLPPSSFINREAEVAQIVSSLQTGLRGDGPTIVVLFGLPGSGKSALARVAVEHVRDDFD